VVQYGFYIFVDTRVPAWVGRGGRSARHWVTLCSCICLLGSAKMFKVPSSGHVEILLQNILGIGFS